MFGKPRDIHDSDILDTSAFDEFFGDESAAENSVEIHELRDRVHQVESQISSQFTSLATYAQIAQEQVELARSEAKAATERSEQRLTSLIERERADRISSYTGDVSADRGAVAPEFTDRLDALEQSVAEIRTGLDKCLERQQALAHAITSMFEWLAPRGPRTAGSNSHHRPLAEPRRPPTGRWRRRWRHRHSTGCTAPNGPIAGLSLEAEPHLRTNRRSWRSCARGQGAVSGRSPCGCRFRPRWDRSASG